MLSKMKFFMCALALTAFYVNAQERAATNRAEAQSGNQAASQNRSGDNDQDQRSNAGQNRSSDTQSRTGDAQERTGTQTRTGQSQTRSTDATTRTQTSQIRRSDSDDNKLDEHIASCLLLGNQKEIALSRFGAERAKDQKVKQFAQHMIQQHTEAIAKLQRFASDADTRELGSSSTSSTSRSETSVNSSRSSSTDASRSSRSSTTPSAQDNDDNQGAAANRSRSGQASASRDATASNDAQTRTSADSSARTQSDANARTTTGSEGRSQASRPGANDDQNRTGVAGQVDSARDRSVTTSVEVRSEHEGMQARMKAMEREAAEKFVALTKSKLEQSSDFDQAFLGAQVTAHIAMIAHLETFRSYASEELRPVIQESHTMAQDHLRQATELIEQLASNGGAARQSSQSRSATGVQSQSSSRTESGTSTQESNREGVRGRRADRDNDSNSGQSGASSERSGTVKPSGTASPNSGTSGQGGQSDTP